MSNIPNSLSVEEIRKKFPELETKVYDRNIIYLDHAATSLKPKEVIDFIEQFYSQKVSNVHRGAHYLSDQATVEFEEARDQVRSFINAKKSSEIVFVKGTTEAINLVASSWGENFIQEGDEIILSEMEHHSNIVPWQILSQKRNLSIRVIPVTSSGELDLDVFDQLLNEKTAFIALTQCSNTLGTINDVEQISKKAHCFGAKVLIDGAQSVCHQPIDVQKLGCDFFVFSGHKLFAPYGIGVLYGREELLDQMPPYQGGGSMIERVSFNKTTYNDLPFKFEAGTPHVVGAVGLGRAMNFVHQIGWDSILQFEHEILEYAQKKLNAISGLKIYGSASHKATIVSFLIEGIHPSDMGSLLDKQSIAVRTGHLCNQPLWDKLGVSGVVRASFSFYNTKEEIDYLCQSIEKVKEFF